ncbi:uncharacterized protein LOC118754981 [Rhagoletis pomonella]|uniref:uncharacterized protein LOC118754981 n=1 Tax=Rhagoletis pomonella TaxID=28610 RepID=UPI00178723F5|nr:uncharacterized protein LOC118754981 [Rhagoletis pomonella]
MRENMNALSAVVTASQTAPNGPRDFASIGRNPTQATLNSRPNFTTNIVKPQDWKVSYDGTGSVVDFLFKLNTLCERTQCTDEQLMLTPDQKIALQEVVQEFPSFEKLGLGQTSLVTHHIDTGDAVPIKNLAGPMTDYLRKSPGPFKLTPEAVEAFSKLKVALCSAPALAQPDFSKEFVIQCDASKIGVGGVLFQLEEEGAEHPIAFVSKKLKTAQRNYTVTELEWLAAIVSVKRFRPYIEGLPFRIITDHSSLKWLMTQKDLSGRLARWSLLLQRYNFRMEHRKGSLNVVPDTLSRFDVDELSSTPPLEIDLASPEFDGVEYSELRETIENNHERLPDLRIVENRVYKRHFNHFFTYINCKSVNRSTNVLSIDTLQQVNVVKINSAGTVISTHTASAQTHGNSVPTIIQSTNNQHITTTATLPASTKIEICTAPVQTTNQAQQANVAAAQNIANAQVCIEPLTLGDVDYSTQTVLSTIQNADGTVSLIQVDPNNPIITLPDGTTAQVQGVATLHQGEGGATIQTVQSLGDVNGHENMTVDLTEATVAQDGQIYITAEDGQGYPVSVSNMITVPVSASMYQSMMANIQQIHTNGDGTVCITPMQVDSHANSSNSRSNNNKMNNTNNSRNHYQCYTLTAAPGGLGARLIATAPTSALPSTVNQSQTNIANNNATNCQIFNQSNLSNTPSSQSSRADHNQHHHQRQQQLQAIPAAAKIFINAASFATVNNNNSISTNNNNKFGNIATAAAVLPLSLPIMVATAGLPATVSNASVGDTNRSGPALTGGDADTSSSKTTTTSTIRKRGANKRRKQTFAKVSPVKLESSGDSSGETLLPSNLQFLDEEADGQEISVQEIATDAGDGAGDGRGSEANRGTLSVSKKIIKIENLEN